MLPDRLLELLLYGISERISITDLQEVTIEANPEDITPESIKFYKTLGVNRISIGVQSFNDDFLASIGRRHSAHSALRALETLAESGINYNADLIYGLPQQNAVQWKNDLNTMLQFAPPHLSAYLLSYEPGTRLYARLTKGELTEATEDDASEMYRILCECAHKSGYSHYEISNFAKPGKEAVHNSLYWNYTPYLGLGASAHSFDGHIRRINPCNTKQYMAAIRSGLTAYTIEDESNANRFNDYIITSLRTSAGYSPEYADSHFHPKLIVQFRQNCRALPLNSLATLPNGNIRISEPKWLQADAILRELIVD